MAIAAVAGLVVEGLYQDPPGLREMYRGYDLVVLIAAVPLLVGSTVMAGIDSTRAWLIRVGVLGFAVYNGALYVFGAAFNDLFLLHAAILTLASVALAREVTGPARSIGLPTRRAGRLAASLLAFLAVGLGAMWVFYSVRFALNGKTPGESQLVVPVAMTHLGYALDLCVLVPLYLWAAVALWRECPEGRLLGALALVAGLGQQLAYMSALVFQARAEIPGSTAVDPAEPVIVAAYVVGAALLLRPDRPARSGSRDRARRRT
jgi:hypothetical protein